MALINRAGALLLRTNNINERFLFTILVLLSCFSVQLFLLAAFFSSFMCTHAQAMNEYCWGEMSTEVVVD